MGLVHQTKYMSSKEQLAIFLYTVVTVQANRKVAEQFQCLRVDVVQAQDFGENAVKIGAGRLML